MSGAPARSPPNSGRTATSRWATRCCRKFREFERGVTASVNASVQPILDRYVERLRKELGGKGLSPATC